MIDAKHTRYRGYEKPHEAGYDSLLTAKNFIRQATQLDVSPELPSETAPYQAQSSTTAASKHAPRFAHQNVFATLGESLDSESAAVDGNKRVPSFSSPVWGVYGNRLRVFGTYERVCMLV